MSLITEKICKLRAEVDRINPACEIVAATKTRSLTEIKEAVSTGFIAAAGENRAQELVEKYVDGLVWDFIGRLQTNKVKYIVGKVRLIHSLDRMSLAEAIEKESVKKNVISDVLIEINTGREENKGGIFLEDAESFYEKLSVFPHIKVRGLMAVAEKKDGQSLREVFDEVYKTFDRMRSEDFRYLSMGMSNDYVAALESGSNMIRPGRIIFGERASYGKSEGSENNLP